MLKHNHRPWMDPAMAGLILAAGAFSGVRAADGPAAGDTLVPNLTELFWALLLLGGLAVAGLVWAGALRREIRRQTTEVQERQAALDAYYRDLFENAHDIILSLDPRGHVLSLNRAGEQVLGYSREEIRGRDLAELAPARERETWRQLLEQAASGTATGHGELELAAKDGRGVVLRLNLRRQALPGRAAHLQGVAWDITERRRAEEALRESEQRLRHSLEERVRIGRDLHDGIIQSLYAVGLNLGECRQLLREDPGAAGERLSKSIGELNSLIREVRGFILGLEPEALKGSEFRTALESLVTDRGSANGCRISVEVQPEAANCLTARQAAHLLQIAREAISNSLRHGQARAAALSLRLIGKSVCLEVRDDGTGFVPGNVSTNGFGLRNIEARSRELKAACEIVSAPGKGTTVRLQLPESELYGLD